MHFCCIISRVKGNLKYKDCYGLNCMIFLTENHLIMIIVKISD